MTDRQQEMETKPPDGLRTITDQAIEIGRLRATQAELVAMLDECAEDLAAEVEGHYAGLKDHPAMTPKYERDMESAIKARALLAKLRGG